MLDHEIVEKQDMVLEGILPLVIEARNMLEIMNIRTEDLDTEELVDNIDKVTVERNMSPKQIKSLRQCMESNIGKAKIQEQQQCK